MKERLTPPDWLVSLPTKAVRGEPFFLLKVKVKPPVRETEFPSPIASSNEPPTGHDDVYLDLALSQRGVCRHRAFAFLVTALHLGIPTRMVVNEAHAWVEVSDGTLWHRIDLGGDIVAPSGTKHWKSGMQPVPIAVLQLAPMPPVCVTHTFVAPL